LSGLCSEDKGCGLARLPKGTGGATAPIPYHKGETCHSLNENFPRNPSHCAVFICASVAAFGGAHSSHTAPHNAKLSLLRQWFPLTGIQKVVAVASLPMTFPVQLLRSALDVDEPTVTQNSQRPFDTGSQAFADKSNRLEFHAAGVPAPRAVFQIAVNCELDRRQPELKNRTVHLE